ncbi:peptidase [Thraustotheca clavata]|uniref:Peptidase n=1 Tax=Thraustotheca clavata TaxID=74557 RepID=A0A1V9ZVN6_9STRA|nr:peptidase [Thraustotheca clavata]
MRRIIGAFLVASTSACSIIGAGFKATSDGSTLLAHTNDAGSNPNDLRLVRVPAMNFTIGAQRPVYEVLRNGTPRFTSEDRGPGYAVQMNQTLSVPLGYIEQVTKTYAYWDHDFAMQNEVQLSIAESTCSCKTAGWPVSLQYGFNLFSIDELSKVALERCDTAVCAIKTMGELAEKHGFYGEYSSDPELPEYGASCEALGVADKHGDLWIFHVLTGRNSSGAIWAAQRVKETDVVTVPNTFVIREMNLSDPDNFLASKDVAQLAYDMQWASPDEPFDFTAAYGYVAPNSAKPLYGGRRMWRIYDLVAPSLHLDASLGFHSRVPTYPFSVTPDESITPETLMRIMQDHYEGTVFDLTKGVAAGPFGDPARYGSKGNNVTGNWERAISMHRTTHSFVLQTRRIAGLSDGVAGLAWYAHGEPANAVYFPIACGQNTIAPTFVAGLRGVMDLESSWWAFHFVSNWAHLRYNVIHREIATKRNAFQMAARVLQQEVDANCSNNQTADACAADFFNEFMADATEQWWQFAWHIVGKYNDGYIIKSNSMGGVRLGSYPDEWLKTTNYMLYPEYYSPPAEVAEEEQNAASVAAYIVPTAMPTITISVGDASDGYAAWHELPPGFLLGFGCGIMFLVLLISVVLLVVFKHRSKQSPKPVENSTAVVQSDQV